MRFKILSYPHNKSFEDIRKVLGENVTPDDGNLRYPKYIKVLGVRLRAIVTMLEGAGFDKNHVVIAHWT